MAWPPTLNYSGGLYLMPLVWNGGGRLGRAKQPLHKEGQWASVRCREGLCSEQVLRCLSASALAGSQLQLQLQPHPVPPSVRQGSAGNRARSRRFSENVLMKASLMNPRGTTSLRPYHQGTKGIKEGVVFWSSVKTGTRAEMEGK